MNKLYHKATVATVCTALSFTLGASEEVKAATFNLTPTIQFGVDASINRFNEYSSFRLSPQYDRVLNGPFRQTKRLAEFNISSFFLTPNTIISRAVFQDKISRLEAGIRPSLNISGYVGNGTAEASDSGFFGEVLSSVDISSSSPGDTLSFDVTTFVNQRARNGNPFVGFAMGISFWGVATLEGTDALGHSSLVIETADVAQPVPEPTTIFGSVIALSVGGWLKRKKSSQKNKTESQR